MIHIFVLLLLDKLSGVEQNHTIVKKKCPCLSVVKHMIRQKEAKVLLVSIIIRLSVSCTLLFRLENINEFQ